MADAAQNKPALMTKKNSPRVTKVTGKVNTTRIGRTTRLSKPITSEAAKAAPKPCTSTPGSRLASASKAVALSSHFNISFMVLSG